MTRILVTGGAGFIGTNLCKALLKNGHDVVAVDNLITGSVKNVSILKKYPRFTFIKHDITKPFPQTLNFQFPAFNFIYHLACPTGVPNIKNLGEEMLSTCSLGTSNVLELARENNARLLFTSSSEVYGNPEKFPQDESYNGNVSPNGFRSPYEEGKRFSESLVKMYVDKYNLDAKIIRVFNTYGPYSSRSETRAIPRFLGMARKNKPLPIEGNGSQTRTFCYVDELLEGFEVIMKKGKKGEVYNLGSDQEIPILDLAKLILLITGSKSKIKFVSRPLHDHNRRLPELSKIEKLGWQARIFLREGLQRTIEAMRNGEY